MRIIIILAILFGVLFFANSCSCDQWFNNGCEFKDTFFARIVGIK